MKTALRLYIKTVSMCGILWFFYATLTMMYTPTPEPLIMRELVLLFVGTLVALAIWQLNAKAQHKRDGETHDSEDTPGDIRIQEF